MGEERGNKPGPGKRSFGSVKKRLSTYTSPLIVVILSGFLGTYFLVSSHAATPAVSSEAESGTVTTAANITDATASGSHAIKFGTGSSGGGTGTMPTASSTGVPAGTSLTTISGDYTMQTAGATLSNTHVAGDLYLSANNLTVHNVQVDGAIVFNGLPGGNYLQSSVSNISIDHCSTPYMNVNFGFNNFTINACHISHNSCTMMVYYPWNGIGNGLTLENSIIDGEQSVPPTGAHCEAIHGFGGTHVSLLNNVIDFRVPDQATWNQTTAAANLSIETSPSNSNFDIEGNWFFGGSYYQMYFIGSNSTVKNNKFTSYTSPDGSATSIVQYPPSAYSSSSLQSWGYGGSYPTFTQSGNTLDGQPYSLPGGN